MINSRTEDYMITRLALSTSVEMGNVQLATRCIRKICSLYVEDHSILKPLLDDSIAFIKELVDKGDFHASELSPKERRYFGEKAQGLLTRFRDMDDSLQLGEKEDSDTPTESKLN